MKVTSHYHPTPHITIENIFPDDVLDSIWNEVDELHEHKSSAGEFYETLKNIYDNQSNS